MENSTKLKIKFNIYRVVLLLFMWVLGVVLGGYYFYAVGHEDINHRLVLSAWNDGYTQGHVRGSSEVMHVLFEDYIKSHPYNVTDEMFKEHE